MKRRKITAGVLKFLAGAVLVFVAMFPGYWLLAVSVRPMDEMKGAVSLVPESLTLEHFTALFTQKDFSRALVNSLQVSLISLIFSLAFGVCAAYVLTRNRFRFRAKKTFNFWILIVRILPPVAFTIPLYTMFNRLGILSTKIPATLSCILINIPFIVWFMISFFQRLPEDIEKSARIDGATEWQLFTKIVLPLAAPGIAAVTMLSFLYAWNEYTYSIIFVQSPKNYTIPLTLATLNSDDSLTNFGLVAAGGIMSVLPVLAFVVFAQNYLIAGLSGGAVKE